MKIDTNKWIPFRIGDLFEKLDLKFKKGGRPNKATDVSVEQSEEFNLPLVNAKNTNNGIMYYGRKADFDFSNMTLDIVQNGASAVGNVYPEVQNTGVLEDAYLIKLKNEIISPSTLCYLATVIGRCVKQYFSYDDKCTWDRVKEKYILLPVTASGDPDWDYMEEYMHCIERAAEGNLSTLRKSKTERKRVDTDTWKEFGVTELFDLSLPKGDIQVKGLDDGNVPLITPSNTNNGLIQYIAEDSKSTLYAAGSLTVDMFGNAYYQDQDFFVTAHGHVNVLLPKNPISPFAGLFVCSSIKSMFLQKYGFKDMCTQKVLKVAKISLPVTPSGKPDWEYMERYMKALECKAKCNFASVNYSVTSCRASCFNHYRLADTLPCC